MDLEVKIKYELFEQQLVRLLHEEPIADGRSHPAEGILENIFKDNSEVAERYIQQVSEKHFNDSIVTAGLVLCLGRLPQPVSFGYTLAERCLHQDEVSVREAAVSYLEQKGGERAIRILSAHHETVKWLGDYISKVIGDLEK